MLRLPSPQACMEELWRPAAPWVCVSLQLPSCWGLGSTGRHDWPSVEKNQTLPHCNSTPEVVEDPVGAVGNAELAENCVLT